TLDIDGDGYLSIAEYQHAPIAQHDPQLAVFGQLDRDGDARLSRAEVDAGARAIMAGQASRD
ncbi:MAG: EF-hand domain-containing protein, partial [Planctomycetota bacterium]